jgi:hypothetical protein
LFTIYERVFNLVCAVAFLCPFLNLLSPGWGPFAVPLTPSPHYVFYSKDFTVKTDGVGKFKWLDFISQRTLVSLTEGMICPLHLWDFGERYTPPHTWGECNMGPELDLEEEIFEKPWRLDMLLFVSPYIRSNFFIFNNYLELNKPHRWLDGKVFHVLTQAAEYRVGSEGKSYLRGSLLWGSTLFLWPDLFNPFSVISLGWPIDLVVSVARGLVRFHLEIWY